MKPTSLSWRAYLKFGVGRRLSLLGERLGIHWMTYNPIVFQSFHNAAIESAPKVMAVIADVFPGAKRYLDVGAGTGAYAAAANRMGLEAMACENSSTGREWAIRQGVKSVEFDLARTPPAEVVGPFDLSYCFEVAEHLPPELGDRLVAFLASTSPTVVFTAAAPGQGGTGHINEQPKHYWISRFEKLGMKHLPDESQALSDGFRAKNITSTWLIQNVIAFSR